jgi:predicted nucleic acid-binding protein
MRRITLADDKLATFVEEELQVRTLSHSEFTAYDVTRALRRRHRDTNIRHEAVRALVHRSMSSLVAAGIYQMSQRIFNGKPAVVYGPAPTTIRSDGPGIPGVPLLPLN